MAVCSFLVVNNLLPTNLSQSYITSDSHYMGLSNWNRHPFPQLAMNLSGLYLAPLRPHLDSHSSSRTWLNNNNHIIIIGADGRVGTHQRNHQWARGVHGQPSHCYAYLCQLLLFAFLTNPLQQYCLGVLISYLLLFYFTIVYIVLPVWWLWGDPTPTPYKKLW